MAFLSIAIMDLSNGFSDELTAVVYESCNTREPHMKKTRRRSGAAAIPEQSACLWRGAAHGLTSEEEGALSGQRAKPPKRYDSRLHGQT